MKHELTRSNDYDFFEEAMRDFFPAFYAPRHAQRYMRTDIKETDDAYLMEVEMPGLDKKDIRLELKDGYLNITANKSEKDEEGKKANYIRRERSYGSFTRSFGVSGIDTSAISAAYNDGVLALPLPQRPALWRSLAATSSWWPPSRQPLLRTWARMWTTSKSCPSAGCNHPPAP